MTYIIVREFLLDIKKMFKKWNLLVFVIFTAIAVGVAYSDDVSSIRLFFLYYTMWTLFIIKPQVGKLQYLLPGDANTRIPYILIRTVGIIILNLIWYCSIYAFNVVIGNLSTVDALKIILCEIIPFLVGYCSLYINSGYNLNEEADDYKRTNKGKYVFTSILIIFPMLNAIVLYEFVHGYWYILFFAISIICAIVAMRFQIKLLKHMDTSYENIKKAEKFI